MALIHKFKQGDNFFVLDVNTGAVHIVDELVYDLVDDNKLRDKEELIKEFGAKYGEETISEAYEELQELVDQDIQESPENYQVVQRDKNIDFRRVKNLNVYFKRHALSLTLDIYDLDKWQGGDIVVFKKHIGIISNYRNKKGITFVIHHAYPHQPYYEEDILEKRNDLIGHYRIS